MWILLAVKGFLSTMFSGIQGVLVIALITGVAGLYGGYTYRDAKCDAAALTIQLAEEQALNKEIAVELALVKQINEMDRQAVNADAATIAELERIKRDLIAQIEKRACFTPADVERLRNLFRATQGAGP